MDTTKDSWTQAHDLALIYIALAYGTDYQLSDPELEAITDKVQGWRTDFGREEAQLVVMEALAIFLEEQSEEEVLHAMHSLKRTLAIPDRQRALEEIIDIAQADGVLLGTERSLISVLAELWEIKATGDVLIRRATASVDHLSWSLMHDISLMYLVMAHSTDNELSQPEIAAILERLHDWQPDLAEADVRQVLRETLEFYSTGPDKAALHRSVETIHEMLPVIQRLALLDDLLYIARADGAIGDEERRMLATLSAAWNVSLRLNGKLDVKDGQAE